MANIKNVLIKNYLITDFIKRYNVNMQEAQVTDAKSYACFNDFFIRKLKYDLRPIAKTDLVSPVDGCISEFGKITEGYLLQAKGKYYSVHEFLGLDEHINHAFINGSFMTLYLSPKDYHRVHMPIEANLINMLHIPGTLFSVKPTTVLKVPRLFVRNERLVVLFETSIGLMAMVLVGATIVGAIGTAWGGDLKRNAKHPQPFTEITLNKAEEMGYFKLGSTVVLMFADGAKIKWDDSIHTGKTIRLGEALGMLV